MKKLLCLLLVMLCLPIFSGCGEDQKFCDAFMALANENLGGAKITSITIYRDSAGGEMARFSCAGKSAEYLLVLEDITFSTELVTWPNWESDNYASLIQRLDGQSLYSGSYASVIDWGGNWSSDCELFLCWAVFQASIDTAAVNDYDLVEINRLISEAN